MIRKITSVVLLSVIHFAFVNWLILNAATTALATLFGYKSTTADWITESLIIILIFPVRNISNLFGSTDWWHASDYSWVIISLSSVIWALGTAFLISKLFDKKSKTPAV